MVINTKCKEQTEPHPYLSASSLACLAWTSLRSRRSALVPTSTMSGLSQYALAWSWPEKRNDPQKTRVMQGRHAWANLKRRSENSLGRGRGGRFASLPPPPPSSPWKDSEQRLLTEHLLIQFLTLRKLCWLVRSNISRKPMASLKKAVVRLRNLEAGGDNCDSRHCGTWTANILLFRSSHLFSIAPPIGFFSELWATLGVLCFEGPMCSIWYSTLRLCKMKSLSNGSLLCFWLANK